jgi:hypothetical protein
MTPSPDLLAVLREARNFVAQNATSERPYAKAYDLLARIDSALSAHEAQGWMPEKDET